MDHEGADRGGDCPDRKLRGLDANTVLLEKSADKKYGADRDEDIFAEKEGDVVDGGSVGPDSVPRSLGKLAVLILGCAFRHRRNERTHHLRVSAQRGKTECRGDLPDGEVNK